MLIPRCNIYSVFAHVRPLQLDSESGWRNSTEQLYRRHSVLFLALMKDCRTFLLIPWFPDDLFAKGLFIAMMFASYPHAHAVYLISTCPLSLSTLFPDALVVCLSPRCSSCLRHSHMPLLPCLTSTYPYRPASLHTYRYVGIALLTSSPICSSWSALWFWSGITLTCVFIW